MQLGFTSFNVGNLAVPVFGRLAQLMEELGYESLWTAEHIVLPDLPPGQTERPGNRPFLDSIAILSYVAAFTNRLKLGTGVLLNLFGGDYARIGLWTGMIYAVGMLLILFAPSTHAAKLED